MRIHQNGPCDNLHDFYLCILVFHALTMIKICGINLCDQCLTRIIHINKTIDNIYRPCNRDWKQLT